MADAQKVWTRDEIAALLERSNAAVERAVVAIFNLQTESEKESGSTICDNGVGFSGADSRRGTYYANWVLDGKHLSRHHLDNARKMCKKYTRQLVMIANGEIEV